VEKGSLLSLLAFICGLLVLFIGSFWLPALVLGVIALVQPGLSKRDKWFAGIGIVLGCLPLIIILMGLIFYMFI